MLRLLHFWNQCFSLLRGHFLSHAVLIYVQVSCDHPETMEQDKYISFFAGVTKAAYNFFRRKLSEQVGYFLCHSSVKQRRMQHRQKGLNFTWNSDLTSQVEKLCLSRWKAYILNRSDLNLYSWVMLQYNFGHYISRSILNPIHSFNCRVLWIAHNWSS